MEGEEDLNILASLLDDDDNNNIDDASDPSLPADPCLQKHDTEVDDEPKEVVSDKEDLNILESLLDDDDDDDDDDDNVVDDSSNPSLTADSDEPKEVVPDEEDLSMLASLLDDDDNDVDNASNPSLTAVLEEKPKEVVSAASTSSVQRKKSQKRKTQEEAKNKENTVKVESFSKLRIINPMISSVEMSRRMEGRTMVPVSKINQKLKGKDADFDWVTIGVLVHKMPAKTSANGKTYGIWKISDLGVATVNVTVALFLFGDVYKQHWKTTEGSVIAMLNPSVLPAREKNSDETALSLDNAKKIMFMGISKDFSHCLASRKDGRPCRNIVNREYGEYCEYHVTSIYKKIKSQRMEFQSQNGAPNKNQLMKKLQKDMGSSTFMYQGKTLSLDNTYPQKARNGSAESPHNGKKGVKGKNVKPKAAEKPSEHFQSLLSLPSIGSRNIARHLEKDEVKADSTDEGIIINPSASQLLKTHGKELKRFSHSENTVPMLGRDLKPGSDIVFTMTSQSRSSKKTLHAKHRALSLVRNKGPIEKADPNAMKRKLSPSSSETVNKRVENSNKSPIDTNDPSSSKAKKRRLLGPEFSAVDVNTDEGKRLLQAKSLNVGQLEEIQAERRDKYFNELEKKEMYEDKMRAVKELTVKVFCCKKCDYVSESASDICLKENHPLKRTTTLKKFFSCKKCGTRTFSYASRLPNHPCSNCGEMNYEKSSLLKERKGPKIGSEALLVRGVEHPKYINT